MYLFIVKGLRGRTSYIAKRYARANNKYMKDYDPTKPSKYVSHLDMNNLRGWEMIRYLPYVNSISKINPKLILNILMNYKYCITIIHQLQKNLQFLMAGCQIIVAKLLTNMK